MLLSVQWTKCWSKLMVQFASQSWMLFQPVSPPGPPVTEKTQLQRKALLPGSLRCGRQGAEGICLPDAEEF